MSQVEELQSTTEQEDKPVALSVSDFALLFELENIAVPGRQATFDLLKSILGEQKIQLTQPLFSRHCMSSLPEHYVPHLLEALDAGKIAADKLLEDLASGLAMFFASKEASLDVGLDRLIMAAQDNGVPMGALSALPEATATALLEKLGLAQRGIELFSFQDVDEVFPRADTWMKIAKSMSKDQRRCVVLSSSASSCKAALSADMACMAVPDRFTAFQDFGGAEWVLDSLDEIDAKELIESLFPILADV